MIVLDRIREFDAPTGGALADLIKDYRYDGLFEIIQK